jgi:hypothetical protein
LAKFGDEKTRPAQARLHEDLDQRRSALYARLPAETSKARDLGDLAGHQTKKGGPKATQEFDPLRL